MKQDIYLIRWIRTANLDLKLAEQKLLDVSVWVWSEAFNSFWGYSCILCDMKISALWTILYELHITSKLFRAFETPYLTQLLIDGNENIN